MDEIYRKLGARIRSIRNEKRITQTSLAESLGKQRSYISQLESGNRTVTYKLMLEICKVLEVGLDALDIRTENFQNVCVQEDIKKIIEKFPEMDERIRKLESNQKKDNK